MPAASLQSMVTRAAMRNATGINDMGDMPYELARPILKKIDNPRQLKEIEDNSPHLREHNADMWKDFIKKHIPNGSKILNETDVSGPTKWRTYYFKLLREKEKQEREDERMLEAAMKGLTREKEANKANFVGKLIPQKFKGSAFVDGQPNPRANSLGIIKNTPALRNAKTGSDAIAAIRKQTHAAVQSRPAGWQGRTTMSTSTVLSGKAQITAAPAWMVRDAAHARRAPPATLPAQRTGSPATRPQSKPPIFMPNTKRLNQTEIALRKTEQEREARLRALTAPKAKPTTATSPPQASAPLARPILTPKSRIVPSPPAAEPKQQQAATKGPAPISKYAKDFTQPTASARPVLSSSGSAPPTKVTKDFTAPELPKAAAPATPPPTIMRKRPATMASVFMPAKKKRG